jgi:pimeloyl-ACP methyl ester carboxylesterase
MTAHDDAVLLPGGPRLALRRTDGVRRPFLLVHGLASNARTWDGVANCLAMAGHEVVAVDQRGHGRSEQSVDGYTTAQCATDLADLIGRLDFSGDRAPVVAGQSWGGNVAVELAAQQGGVAGVALIDGGWIQLSRRFATFDECWKALEPPWFDEVRADELTAWFAKAHPDWSEEGRVATMANFEMLPDGAVRPWLRRDHHREIVRSMFEAEPAASFPDIDVPVLLVPVVGNQSDEVDVAKRAAVAEAESLLVDASTRWYLGADHDVHVQHPQQIADDLLGLAARVEAKTP